MKRGYTLFIMICLLLVAGQGCGPVPHYLTIESKQGAKYELPLQGREVAVLMIQEESMEKDSAVIAELGTGVAEKIEQECGYVWGDVPVFVMSDKEINISEPGAFDIFALQSGSEIIVCIDSVSLGSYGVEYGDEMRYVANVTLPVSADLCVYDSKGLKMLAKHHLEDVVVWSIVGEREIARSKAVAKANSVLKTSIKEVGSNFASVFFPQWREEQRMIITYENNQKWMAAYYNAVDFKWDEAIEKWLELVKSPNLEKSASAAYNLAVACEIQGKYDVALKWLDYAESKCYFAQIPSLREKIKANQK